MKTRMLAVLILCGVFGWISSNSSVRPAAAQTVQQINLATQAFGILPIASLPALGVPLATVTGTTFTVACGTTLGTSDNTRVKYFNNTGAIAVTLFQAGTCTWASAFVWGGITDTGAGTLTITPTTSTIGKNGGAQGATLAIAAASTFTIYTDTTTSGCTSNGCWDAVVGP